MHDEKHVVVIEDAYEISARLGDELSEIVLRVAPDNDFEAKDECGAVIAQEIWILERLRALGYDGALILVTDRGLAPRLRAARAGIAVFTHPLCFERIAETLRCYLSKPIPPRLECASCLTTTNLEPVDVRGVVFFCEDCLEIAHEDPDDPLVDFGGPNAG